MCVARVQNEPNKSVFASDKDICAVSLALFTGQTVCSFAINVNLNYLSARIRFICLSTTNFR